MPATAVDSPLGILLAAGAGSRMGRPKALVRDESGQSWLALATTTLLDAGCRPVLVALGADVTADVLPAIGHELHPALIDAAIHQLRTFLPQKVWREALRAAPPS